MAIRNLLTYFSYKKSNSTAYLTNCKSNFSTFCNVILCFISQKYVHLNNFHFKSTWMRHPKVSYIPFYIDYTTMKLRKMVLSNHKDFLSSMGAIAKTTCCHCEKRFSAFYVTGNFPTVWVSLEGGSSKSSRDNEELTFSLCLKNPKNQVKFFFVGTFLST